MTVSIPSIAYLLRRDDVDEGEATSPELFSGPARLTVDEIPPDWTDKWSHFGDLDKWQVFPDGSAWWIKHCWNFVGQSKPLYRQHNEGIISVTECAK